MDHRYAKEKLTLLLRDLDSYTSDEFWRQMSRIAAGATGADHAEEIAKERDAWQRMSEQYRREAYALAAHVERLTACANAVYVANNVGNVAGFDKLLDAVDESPTTSLTKLKAQWLDDTAKSLREAEARSNLEPGEDVPLEDVELSHMWDTSEVVDWMNEQAAELRCQAEEPTE